MRNILGTLGFNSLCYLVVGLYLVQCKCICCGKVRTSADVSMWECDQGTKHVQHHQSNQCTSPQTTCTPLVTISLPRFYYEAHKSDLEYGGICWRKALRKMPYIYIYFYLCENMDYHAQNLIGTETNSELKPKCLVTV